jgi:hypothetical protein
MASADSEVRPDPGPTLRPHHRKTSEAGPEHLSTSSLPTMHFVEMISAGYPGSAYHALMGRVNATLVELVTAAHRERQLGWLGSCGRAGQPAVSIWSAGTGLRPGARSV